MNDGSQKRLYKNRATTSLFAQYAPIQYTIPGFGNFLCYLESISINQKFIIIMEGAKAISKRRRRSIKRYATIIHQLISSTDRDPDHLLPLDVLAVVFKHFDPFELTTLINVCKSWKLAIEKLRIVFDFRQVRQLKPKF